MGHCEKKIFRVNMCLILNGYRDGDVRIFTLNSVNFFFLWGWMKTEVYQRKAATRDELHARILDAAALIKRLEDQFRRVTHDLRTRVSKCVEVDGGIFENLYEV